jgi:hypothetical protein
MLSSNIAAASSLMMNLENYTQKVRGPTDAGKANAFRASHACDDQPGPLRFRNSGTDGVRRFGSLVQGPSTTDERLESTLRRVRFRITT